MSLRRRIATVTAAVALAGLLSPAAVAGVGPLAIKQVASGLNQAWAVDFLPDGTPLFTQRNARSISRITGGAVEQVQTINDAVVTAEGGLLGLAVSPDYATDQTVFIYYTSNSDNRIAKLTLGSAPTPIVTGIPRGSQYHHGGRLRFGPDGYLYAGTGDGQNADNAQNDGSLGGKVLRVDTDGNAAPGNPGGHKWISKGHRNVQGVTWAGSDLYIADIGPSDVDELNKIEPGGNYGWPTCSGPCSNPAFKNPVKTWPTSTATPSGLAYYKNSLYMASLKGGTFKLTTSGEGGKIYPELGRTRDEVAGPDGQLWVVTPSAIYTADGS
ncbi:sorbosone dehydrogenase family protein [Amycolatopsis sp. 195334CR]|uniref:PQQ-dependent sugar dehydrogenase n=1 Tax=Amycolatopsis sp. 195334CR TaxID=2814588 RepID=UPI001A8C87DE|nr:PQQ-dependent sugar dehydrogenase [Amycolatopsis sp. 195334CR]MBN6038839.1 PQQ-dependent sugar dehydrogenase [Amycolatopsis sp. 195334CR]